VLEQLVSCGQRFRVRCLPAGGLEQATSGVVDVVPPGGEQAGVAPLPDGICDRRARFQHEWCQIALAQMGCRGQPDRAGSDDDDRKVMCQGAHFAFSFCSSSTMRLVMRCLMLSRTSRIRSMPSMPRCEGSSVRQTSMVIVMHYIGTNYASYPWTINRCTLR